MYVPRAMYSLRMSFWMVPCRARARDAALVGDRDVEAEQRRRRGVDGHRGRDAIERQPVEQASACRRGWRWRRRRGRPRRAPADGRSRGPSASADRRPPRARSGPRRAGTCSGGWSRRPSRSRRTGAWSTGGSRYMVGWIAARVRELARRAQIARGVEGRVARRQRRRRRRPAAAGCRPSSRRASRGAALSRALHGALQAERPDLGHVAGGQQRGLGLRLNLLDRDAGRALEQRQPARRDVQHGQIGDDPVHRAHGGQRQRAARRGSSFRPRRSPLRPGDVLHHDDHALGRRDQIHRAAHALDHLAGDHPVGEIAVLRDLHRAQDGAVDVAAADHGERLGRREIGAARQLGDRLLAGVDEVGILVALVGEGADAQHAVLRLQHDVRAGGMKFATSVGMPMPRFTYMPSRSSRAARWAIWSRVSGGMARRSSCGRSAARWAFRSAAPCDDALDVDPGRVDAVGIELARLDQDLDLGDGDAPGGGDHRVEVAGGLPVDQVAEAIALPGLDDGQVGAQRRLEHVHASVEFARLLALGDLGAVAGRRVEGRDPGAARADALGQRSLRGQLDVQLAVRYSRSKVLFSPT